MAESARYLRLIGWREKHIKESNFILILSFVVGLLTSVAALLLKGMIHWVEKLMTSSFSSDQTNYLYLIFPAIGILLTSLFVRLIVKDDIGHGVTHILYAISRRQGRLKSHNMWTSLVGSSLTIGMGGSVGAEAPIAGMLFTIEVLMLDLTAASVLPLLISAITAATLSYVVTGTQPMFAFDQGMPFELNRLPWVAVLSVACGLVSLYFIRGMSTVEGWYKKMQNPYTKIAVGAVVLSVLIFIFPPLYGEGYTSISQLISGCLLYTSPS